VASKKKSAGLLLDEVLPQAQRTARSLLSLDPQEDVPASQQALEMALGFVPGIGQAMALRDIERARRANDPAAAAMAATEFVPFGRLAGMMRRPGPIMSEIDVYHGSPHRFEEFDASKIGTGEGAQAYGHGIYLAENPAVAEGYRKVLGEQKNPYKANVAVSRMATLVDEFDGDVEKAADRFMKSVYDTPKAKAKMRQGLVEEFKSYSPKGQLYTADLPDEMVDRMLDWDKPLSEQSPSVLAALEKSKNKQIRAMLEYAKTPYTGAGIEGETKTMGEAYRTMSMNLSGRANAESAKASKLLQQAGIPGVRYLDAGSRGQGGSGTRNFVVFPGEEKKVKIKKRE
jgi:hypothetical protein